jgi:ferredoxin
MKNIFGFVPGFNKAMQHVNYPNRYKFARFFVDLEEAVRPHFHIMDGIVAMEGPGPGNGYPKKVNVLLASSNPLALDIVASRIVGYDPLDIPTNRIALERGSLLSKTEDIKIKGPEPEAIAVRDFRRIYKGGEAGILLKHLKKKIPILRRFDRRPVFKRKLCIGCLKCVEICPVKILHPDERKKNTILINDAKCIRCFCCSEVCRDRAIEIRRKIL